MLLAKVVCFLLLKKVGFALCTLEQLAGCGILTLVVCVWAVWLVVSRFVMKLMMIYL